MKNIHETQRNIKNETIKETVKRNRTRAKQIRNIYQIHKNNTNYQTFLSYCKQPETVKYILETKYSIQSVVYNSEFLQVKIDR